MSTPPNETTGNVDALDYETGECALGRVLVARSAHGLVAVLLGDDDATLLDDLAERFHGAAFSSGGESRSHLAAVVALIEDPRATFEEPLDARGTAFQRLVWDALRDIPAGETRSYSQVASAIGAPTATRAVAGACAANPLAVVVPCHRVVRADGDLSGYRWGSRRKRALLERESSICG